MCEATLLPTGMRSDIEPEQARGAGPWMMLRAVAGCAAPYGLEKMVRRLRSRTAFGKRLSEQSVWEQRIAEARIDIERARDSGAHRASLLRPHSGDTADCSQSFQPAAVKCFRFAGRSWP